MAINPKSEVAKTYMEAIMKDFANKQRQVDLKAMQATAELISEQERIQNEALAAALNDQKVSTLPF